jgi:hypothetical protein
MMIRLIRRILNLVVIPIKELNQFLETNEEYEKMFIIKFSDIMEPIEYNSMLIEVLAREIKSCGHVY